MGKEKNEHYEPEANTITSTNDSQSSILAVTREEIQTTMITHFNNDDLFFTTTISLKNVGSTTVNNVTCKS
jgi:hypothetical protein